ncbi:hypothetical protein HZH68_011638 [Vespula germanica]|uniref:Uncharacterized protein n=1 Tax=Vespula germanica TaxID=30212 RepID=A0A834JJQ9_VESGE|nr:hypothetical protein HZH68_011638 [Vespula germanica]
MTVLFDIDNSKKITALSLLFSTSKPGTNCFSPTTSRHEKLPRDIVEAELVGRNGSCSKYQPQCPVGLFDLIGVLV